MTSTEPYTAAATQARRATENSVEVFKKGAKSFTDQLELFRFPTVDLTEPVVRYFDYVQKVVDVNRDLATKWAELATSLSGSVREQAEKATGVVKDQADTVADLAVNQAQQTERVAKDQAETVDRANRERAALIEDAEKERAREVRKVERAQAKQAREQAREPYEGLTKAELSDHLAERGLPKTGNVDELIERLVGADSE